MNLFEDEYRKNKVTIAQ